MKMLARHCWQASLVQRSPQIQSMQCVSTMRLHDVMGSMCACVLGIHRMCSPHIKFWQKPACQAIGWQQSLASKPLPLTALSLLEHPQFQVQPQSRISKHGWALVSSISAYACLGCQVMAASCQQLVRSHAAVIHVTPARLSAGMITVQHCAHRSVSSCRHQVHGYCVEDEDKQCTCCIGPTRMPCVSMACATLHGAIRSTLARNLQ